MKKKKLISLFSNDDRTKIPVSYNQGEYTEPNKVVNKIPQKKEFFIEFNNGVESTPYGHYKHISKLFDLNKQ